MFYPISEVGSTFLLRDPRDFGSLLSKFGGIFALQVAFHLMVASLVGTKPINRVIYFIFQHLGDGATREPNVTCSVLNSPLLMTPEVCKASLIKERN